MRLLIVDDQEYIRRGIRALLTEIGEIDICGEAIDGTDAVIKASQLNPDVILMDISMPRLDGFDATREIRRLLPKIRVVTVSQYDLPGIIEEAMDAGAWTHVSKLDIWTQLVPVLRNLQTNQA